MVWNPKWDKLLEYTVLHFEHTDLVKGSASIHPGPKHKTCSLGSSAHKAVMASVSKPHKGDNWWENSAEQREHSTWKPCETGAVHRQTIRGDILELYQDIPGTSLDKALYASCIHPLYTFCRACWLQIFLIQAVSRVLPMRTGLGSCFLDASSCRSLISWSFEMISASCNLRDGLWSSDLRCMLGAMSLMLWYVTIWMFPKIGVPPNHP